MAFSRPVKAAEVPREGIEFTFDANEVERAALARRLGVEAVESFGAEFSVTPWRRHGLRVSGVLRARVEQRCVVTLEPVWNDIEERFAGTFEPPAKAGREERVVDFDALEQEDPPEEMVGGAADVGALAVEYLALAIDPYPRAPGADLEQEMPQEQDVEPAERDKNGAFDVLRRLK